MTAKLYYSISEVSKLVDEEQHILRYWEKEFNLLKPRKNRAGNRIYSAKDIKVVKCIKKILRQDKLSLKGAKERLVPLFESNEMNDDFDLDVFMTETEKVPDSGVVVRGSIISKSDLFEIINLLKQVSEKLKP